MNNIDEINAQVTAATLSQYYKNSFPLQLIIDFLTQNGKLSLAKRTLCFSYCYENGTQALHRYTSVDNVEAFQKKLTPPPYRIDVSAVMSCIPNKRFIDAIGHRRICYQAKELIFDIDVKPFNWQYIRQAAKDLNNILKNTLGYEKLFFTFSGSKGVHCWVCDEHVMQYSVEERKDVVELIFSKYPYLKKDATLDIRPTTDMGHLIKLPFSVHPITAKICIPIDIDKIDTLEISSLPTIKSDAEEMKIHIDYFRNVISYL